MALTASAHELFMHPRLGFQVQGKINNKLQLAITSRPMSTNLHSAQSHPTLRKWQSRGTDRHSPEDFVLPLFIIPDDDGLEEIPSMPGVNRYGLKRLLKYLDPLVKHSSLKSVLLFPVVRSKDKGIEDATNPIKNPVLRAIPVLKNCFPDLLIMCDVCLCGFTNTGHCCVFTADGRMDNEQSVVHLSELSMSYAKAGAHVIAPSDMMDGRVAGIRQRLDANNFTDVSIMSYSSKFSSCFYGPFRDAAGSAPKFGDRQCYQLPPGSAGMAMNAVTRDIREGADTVMVKPGLPYLDIVKEISIRFPDVPISVYHVSGEFAMLTQGAVSGAFDLEASVMEIMTSFKRAGATIIITYFTPQILQWINQ